MIKIDQNKTFVKAIVDRMKKVIGVSTDKELAEYLGGSKSGPAVWKIRGSIPIAECIALAEEKGVSLDWLILGRGAQTTNAAEFDNKLSDDSAASFYVELPVFDMATFFVQDESKQVSWRMQRSWLAQEDLNAADTIVVRAVGDSMAGTINNGQLVVIDRRARDTDGVFLVRFGDTIRFKRVQRMVDGSLRLSYDNPAYAVDTVANGDEEKIEIIGYCHAVVARVK